MSEATRILNAIRDGDVDAGAALLPLVYHELRQLAQQQMRRERSDHTLQATALVHEAYLRLVGNAPVKWDNQGHFFAAAAEAMRRILVEHARQKNAAKRGGGENHLILENNIPAIQCGSQAPEDLLALNLALDQLAAEHPAKAELVKLRYFAGLSLAEAAQILGFSRATANRHWVFARAWLHDAIKGHGDRGI